MKKTIKSIIIALSVLFVLLPTSVFASNENRVVDDAHLLSQVEEEKLERYLKELSDSLQCDICVFTTNDTQGKEARLYAADLWDDNGYGYGANHDGIVLIINMSNRWMELVCTGRCMDYFMMDDMDNITGAISSNMSNGYYYDAFTYYAKCAANIIEYHDSIPQRGTVQYALFIAKDRVWMALGAAAVVTIIAVAIMAAKNKSVRRQSFATNYAINGSFHCVEHHDMFLYRNVTRRIIPRNDDSSGSRGGGGGGSHFSSSSGGSHSSGGGRHF